MGLRSVAANSNRAPITTGDCIQYDNENVPLTVCHASFAVGQLLIYLFFGWGKGQLLIYLLRRRAYPKTFRFSCRAPKKISLTQYFHPTKRHGHHDRYVFVRILYSPYLSPDVCPFSLASLIVRRCSGLHYACSSCMERCALAVCIPKRGREPSSI